MKLLIGCFIKCYEGYEAKDQKKIEYLCQGIHDIITACSEEKNMKNQLLHGLIGVCVNLIH